MLTTSRGIFPPQAPWTPAPWSSQKATGAETTPQPPSVRTQRNQRKWVVGRHAVPSADAWGRWGTHVALGPRDGRAHLRKRGWEPFPPRRRPSSPAPLIAGAPPDTRASHTPKASLLEAENQMAGEGGWNRPFPFSNSKVTVKRIFKTQINPDPQEQ